ncbi:MAG: MATE family efflux transporter [Clostridia bacterium]|nr:MATE family efflux transporter [Clostridia bacterium]
MTKNTSDFSKGSILSNIVRLAVPMTLAQLINVLYNIVDRIYIGRMGENSSLALTGLGVCLPIITIVMAFANLIGMGGAPLFSIKRGEGNEEEAEKIMGNCLTLLIIFGVSLTVIGLIIKRPLLMLLGASENTLPYADEYITVYLLGNVFVMLSLGLNSFINAQGFGKTGMLTVFIGAGLNIVLDPIFIYKMGVQGAALATVISQFVAAVWTFRFLTGRKAVIRLKLSAMKCQLERIKRILLLGLSGFTMAITNSLVQIVCNASLQSYGSDVYVGAMTIINSVREVVSMPVMGLTNSAQPIVGFNYGAKEFGRVKDAIKYLSAILIGYTLLAWAFVSAFPNFLMGIFTADAELIRVGVPSMHIYFFGFCFMALQFSGQTIFTGTGKAKQAIFFSIFRKVIIVVPLTLLLPMWFGVNGVFMAEPVSNLIGGAACFITMYLTVYKKL